MMYKRLVSATIASMSIGSSHADDKRIVSNTENLDVHFFQLDFVGEFNNRNGAHANTSITKTNAANLTEQAFHIFPYKKELLIAYEESSTEYNKGHAYEEDKKHEYEDFEHHSDGEHKEDGLKYEEEDKDDDDELWLDDEDGEEEEEDGDEEWWLNDEDGEEDDEDEERWLDDEEDEDGEEDEDQEWWLDDEEDEDEDDEDDEEWYDNIDYIKYLSGAEMYEEFGISLYDILWEQNDCDEVFALEPIIPQDSTFELLQEIYVSIVGTDKSSLIDGSGSHVAGEVRQSEGKGRGVFATEPIQKGTLSWTNRKSAIFSKGSDYRKYIEAIPEDMTCNILMWTYVQSYSADNSPDDAKLVVELDDSCMVNAAGWMDKDQINDDLLDKGGTPNTMCVLDSSEKETGMACYATVDIKAGDEFLADYDDWNFPHGWSLFNMYD